MPFQKPLKVFLSYSHDDEVETKLFTRFRKHLESLVEDGIVTLWHDRKITAGLDWDQTISDALGEAHLFIALTSANFGSSGYINGVELATALKRQEEGTCRLIPVHLRSWRPPEKLKRFQSLRQERAVEMAPNVEDALKGVIEDIESAIDEMLGGKWPASQPATGSASSAGGAGFDWTRQRPKWFTEMSAVRRSIGVSTVAAFLVAAAFFAFGRLPPPLFERPCMDCEPRRFGFETADGKLEHKDYWERSSGQTVKPVPAFFARPEYLAIIQGLPQGERDLAAENWGVAVEPGGWLRLTEHALESKTLRDFAAKIEVFVQEPKGRIRWNLRSQGITGHGYRFELALSEYYLTISGETVSAGGTRKLPQVLPWPCTACNVNGTLLTIYSYAEGYRFKHQVTIAAIGAGSPDAGNMLGGVSFTDSEGRYSYGGMELGNGGTQDLIFEGLSLMPIRESK